MLIRGRGTSHLDVRGGLRPARGPTVATWGFGSDAGRGGCPQRRWRIHSGSPDSRGSSAGCSAASSSDATDPAAGSFGWTRFWDAWQWRLTARLGMALLLLAATMAALMWRERRGLSTAAAGAWAAAALALTVLVASASTDTGIDPVLWTGPGAALVGAAVASDWWPA